MLVASVLLICVRSTDAEAEVIADESAAGCRLGGNWAWRRENMLVEREPSAAVGEAGGEAV